MPTELDHIHIVGAREHNLKNVEVKIPKKKFVVITGVSGSGKSSLAFDTLYAEGQRRYVESLSAYARQFLGQMDKPRYDTIRGLGPTISIEQKTTGNNPRSTVGTITEISDYLRVLYARVGIQHCHHCGQPVKGQSATQIASELASIPKGVRLWLLSPLLVNRKGEHRDLLEQVRQDGFIRIRVDGEMQLSADLEALDKRKKHNLEVVVDRLVSGKVAASRLQESVELALKQGKGSLIVIQEQAGKQTEQIYSEHLACEACGVSFPELTPQSFSFNSPQGMCGTCNGLGTRVEIDPARVVTDDSLSIDGGAIAPWGEDASEKKTWDFRAQILKHLKLNTKRPFRELNAKQRRELLYGTGEKKYQVVWSGNSGSGKFKVSWEGLIPRLMRRFRQTQSERARKWYSQFLGTADCPDCGGCRLRKESAAVRVADRTIPEVSHLTVAEAAEFFANLKLKGSSQEIATEVLKELASRIGFLSAVGLGYLSLDRAGPSLSGGEAQRIRLASQVGSELTGVIYVLDEPSIGLHQRDNERLLKTLFRMRDIGNTVVCVEHDEDTIRAADHVIDFGPGAGIRGGEVTFSGSAKALLKSKGSSTGAYLAGKKHIESGPRREARGWLEVKGARENNLKDIDVRFPVGVLTAVTGVSGAGKSTLVNDILTPVLERQYQGSTVRIGQHGSVRGTGQLDRIISIDQRAIGRTPRSNPITYIKVFDEIRRFFALLPEAKTRGYAPGRFSFNVKGGRCESCEGDGVRKIEMHFLADVYVRCEQCHGKRYNEATLDVLYKGKNIADVLALTVHEALLLFKAHPKISGPLKLLEEVGLEYLPLGQPSPTLSGGEAQRIKLAKELSKRATGKTIYVLDEPTTGLHFDDIAKLLSVLHRLVDAGNTVVVIEHNLDVVRCADHVIDLGSEGGPLGGQLVAFGTPEDVAAHKSSHTGRFLKRALASAPVQKGGRGSPKSHAAKKKTQTQAATSPKTKTSKKKTQTQATTSPKAKTSKKKTRARQAV